MVIELVKVVSVTLEKEIDQLIKCLQILEQKKRAELYLKTKMMNHRRILLKSKDDHWANLKQLSIKISV